MVDIETQNPKPKSKFSPKFEEGPVVKKAKKNKNSSVKDENTSPVKKMKLEGFSDVKKEKKTPSGAKDKKKIKFNENVKVREMTAPDDRKKAKFTKAKGKDGKDGKFGKGKDGKFGKGKDGKFGKGKYEGKKVKIGGEPFKKLDKKETREKMKQVKEQRKKLKQDDVFDIGVKAKKVWEEVRTEDCPEAKKEKLVNELHSLVAGNIKKLIYAHDTVRVVECLMALGSEEIRSKLFTEMKDEIIEMTKSKYAHFFVQKMLRYGSKDQKKIILKEMEGKIAKLMKNKTAGNVVETIYNDIASGPQRNSMLQEFLDMESMHFKESELRSVPDLLAKYPNRKKDCVQNLQRNVEVLIRKGAFNHSLAHTVIYNYLLVAEPKNRSEMIEQLRDSLVHMAHSREGAYAALQCIWHGTAKDRKAIIKSFKTFMLKTAQEEYGHMVLLGIFESVDDTKLVGKAVIGELLENPEELFKNKFGVRLLKGLFAGRDSKYVYPDSIKILEKGDGNEHSKKERSVRQKELLAVAAPPILDFINQGLPSDLYDSPTTITLTCIINNSPVCEQLSSLFATLALHVTKPFAKGDSAPNLVENTGSSMMFRKIIAKDQDRQTKGEETFSANIMKALSDDGLESWVLCQRGCFLLVNMWDTQLPEIQAAVKSSIKAFSSTLEKQQTQGAQILLQKLN